MESAPSLAFPCLSWPVYHTVLLDHVGQPVPTAIPHDIAVQEHQLALWAVEPVVVGVCDGNTPLES